jgi:hypothetical protein
MARSTPRSSKSSSCERVHRAGLASRDERAPLRVRVRADYLFSAARAASAARRPAASICARSQLSRAAPAPRRARGGSNHRHHPGKALLEGALQLADGGHDALSLRTPRACHGSVRDGSGSSSAAALASWRAMCRDMSSITQPRFCGATRSSDRSSSSCAQSSRSTTLPTPPAQLARTQPRTRDATRWLHLCPNARQRRMRAPCGAALTGAAGLLGSRRASVMFSN